MEYFIATIVIVGVADCWFFYKAPWPEKRSFWWWLFPFSGFYAYFKFKR